jgi:hypothetical protein
MSLGRSVTPNNCQIMMSMVLEIEAIGVSVG